MKQQSSKKDQANIKDAIGLLMDDHKEVKKMFKEYESLSDRSVVTKRKLAADICQALEIHTQIEEEIFYPAVRKIIKQDDLMDEAVVEHSSAKDLIKQIKRMDPDDELYDAKVKVLSEQIEHHVMEEESEMFPKVMKSKIDLKALGEDMANYKEQIESSLVQKLKNLVQ